MARDVADDQDMIAIYEKFRSAAGQRFTQRQSGESSHLSTAFRHSKSGVSTARNLGEAKSQRLTSSPDAAFTLIELMVVLLILAILLAIAIPTFLGVSKSANDRAAQSNLDSALVNAKSIFQQNNQSYALTSVGATYVTSNGTLMASSLYAAVPNLTFTTGAVTPSAPASVSVAVVDNNGIALAEQAKGTNNCWFVIDNAGTEAWTTTGTGSQPNAMGTWYGESKAATTCSAASPPAPNGSTIVYSQAGFPNL
jgi:type IV pilus assembly protein PilA